MIHLKKCIEESWHQTIEQSAEISDEVAATGQIQTEIMLDQEMGDVALAMFESVMQGKFDGFEPWIQSDKGHYHYDLDDVTLTYIPDTHQLTVSTQISQMVSASAKGVSEATGVTVGQIEAKSVADYYDDGWGGHTESHAREIAQKEAERQLQENIQQLHQKQHQQEIANATKEAKQNAMDNAKIELTKVQDNVRSSLHEQIQTRLSQSKDQVFHVMNRMIGEAYRQTLMKIAHMNGGQILKNEKSGSIIQMELEI